MSIPDDITIGGLAEIEGHFVDVDGTPIDPTNLTLLVVGPDGGQTNVDPTSFEHVATGHYRAPFSPTLAGTHTFLWGGSGLRPVAVDGEFYVREPLTSAPEGWQPPSAATVWDHSRVDFAAAGFPSTTTLVPVVEEAAGWITWATGRKLDETLPVELRTLARQAVRMRTEQMAMRTDGDAIQAATTEGIASVSVSGLSVSFRDPRSSAGLGSGRYSTGSPFPTSWDALNEILLALMTDDRLEWWKWHVSGTAPPEFAVTEQAFRFQGDFEPPDYDGMGASGGWPGWGLQ